MDPGALGFELRCYHFLSFVTLSTSLNLSELQVANL